ncbi:MAG: hypothetical protein QM697_04150 [Lachnospiraceae bacterium]
MKGKMITIGLAVMALCLMAGCGAKAQEQQPAAAEKEEAASAETDGDEEPVISVSTESDGAEAMEAANTGKEQTETEQAEKEQPDAGTSAKEGNEILDGHVINIAEDSVLISRIFTEDLGEGGLVAVSGSPESGEEVFLTVHFSETAEYKFQTVRNGGEDVESREGTFQDIKKYMILNMTGSWDGDDFYADQVTISEFK